MDQLLSYIPEPLRVRFIQFLVGRICKYLVTFITLGVATGVAKVAAFMPAIGPQLAQLDQVKLVAIIFGVLVVGLKWLAIHTLTKNSALFQAALVKYGAELDVDGWIGDKTVKAIEERGIEVRKALPVAPATPLSP